MLHTAGWYKGVCFKWDTAFAPSPLNPGAVTSQLCTSPPNTAGTQEQMGRSTPGFTPWEAVEQEALQHKAGFFLGGTFTVLHLVG